MVTGLPTKEVFQIVVNYVARFKQSINYFAGWRVQSTSFEEQIFITLMKVRQNYTNLHLAQLFNCSVSTIANIVTTFIHHSYTQFYLLTSWHPSHLGIRTSYVPHHLLVSLVHVE